MVRNESRSETRNRHNSNHIERDHVPVHGVLCKGTEVVEQERQACGDRICVDDGNGSGKRGLPMDLGVSHN